MGYEVILPNGRHAVAKRCLPYSPSYDECERGNSFHQAEANLLESLQNQFGEDALPYFGKCRYPKVPDGDRTSFDKMARNFSLGATTFTALGAPLAWRDEKGAEQDRLRKLYGSSNRRLHAASDMEALRVIARMFSTSLPTALEFSGDCGKREQYARGVDANNKHRIYLFDVVLARPAPRSQTPTEVLQTNCEYLFWALGGGKKRWESQETTVNCTRAYSRQLQTDKLARGEKLVFPLVSLVDSVPPTLSLEGDSAVAES